MKKLLICLMGLTLIISKDKPKVEVFEDPFFKNDLPYINLYLENPFNPKSIPTVGKTREEDILKFYLGDPNARKSFRIVQTRKIHSKICKYNREILLQQLTSDSVNNEDYAGYRGREYIYFWVYFLDDITSCYTIKHLVRETDGEWDKGKYDMNIQELVFEKLREERYAYWSQRTQDDRNKYEIKSFMVNDRPWTKEAE